LPIAQRLQDKRYSWDDLKLLVPDMVSAGIIGHPFSCPDMIGGGLLSDFENIDYNKFDQELMIRSAQTQALMPMMQFSVAPWRVLDTMHLRLSREVALLHVKMGEYIFQLAQNAAKDGEPIVRHMEYVFPGQGFESSNDQYMLGENYLVAPMLEKGNARTVKLPKGNWIDDTGKKYKGGQTVKVDVPLNRLPYFIKQK
jgi:alpha-glucosidase